EGTILAAGTLAAREQALAGLAQHIRLVLAAATLGTLLGFLGQRAFAHFFAAGVALFEQVGGSVPRLVCLLLCRPRRAGQLARRHALPYPPAVRPHDPPGRLPRGFLALNVLVTGIFTTGVLSALYAGALYPDYRASATMLASLVNGIAQVLFATVVDPTAARLTDHALQGQRPFADVQRMAFHLAATRLAGTVLAQFIFLPAAYLIRFVAVLIT
ncbi:MAG: lipid II flippase family protein, partial [Bacillota bacterium]